MIENELSISPDIFSLSSIVLNGICRAMFYITIKNGLLDNGHRKRMGEAIWLFLWLLDKMTIINHETGEGQVLGGKPIKFEEIEKNLEISRATYARWIKILKDNNYIDIKRTPYGLIITVFKAFKIFNQKINSETSKKRDVSIVKHPQLINETSIIDKTVDKTTNIISKDIIDSVKHPDFFKKTYGNETINKLNDFLKEKVGLKVLDRGIKDNRFACYSLINLVKKQYPNIDPIEPIKEVIELCLKDSFHAKNCTSFRYLLNNFFKIKNNNSFKSDVLTVYDYSK